jgi:hypothetical protein
VSLRKLSIAGNASGRAFTHACVPELKPELMPELLHDSTLALTLSSPRCI